MSEQAAPPPGPTPLLAEPGRQAVASLGGYSYQLWQSLLAWLTLPFDERLQLEGNEDIDILRGNTASTTQVKRVSKAMTLRSDDAVEAINNYWKARERNPSIRLTFKYLSTAEAGRETGDHFGGRKGIEVWRAARRGVDRRSDVIAAKQIQAFLLSLQSLAAGLRTWLEAAAADDVLADLVTPFDWELGTADTAEVRLLVEEQLVRLGDGPGVFPSNARRAAPALLEKILATATNPGDRFLDRTGLLDAFEGATAVTVPISASGFLGRSARPIGLPTAGMIATFSQAVEAAARDGVPELPSILLRRDDLVASVTAKHAQGFVCLNGSTGMGKSTLASLAVSRMNRPPLWLDLRGNGEHYAVIRAASSLMVRTGSFRSLVLDDLSFGGDDRLLQDAVAVAFSATRAFGGSMLVTSATELPLSLLLRLQLTADRQIKVPPLDEPEIDQLLLAHGLADAKARRRWAKLVSLQTQGHPQLVDARVQALRHQGFPSIGPADLNRVPAEISEIRQQARSLIAGLPSNPRDLLYRLSLNAMLFKRTTAIRIAGIAPPLGAPGDALDALVGPWIEKTPGRRYRVSPLAVNAGFDANGDEWTKRTHHGIASKLLAGQLDQFDVAAICMHAIAGGNGRALATVCGTLFSHAERLAEIADMLGWLVHVDPSSPQLGLDRKSIALVRIAQFDIAAHMDAATAETAVQALETHTRLLPGASPSDRSARLIAICKMMMRTEVHLHPRLIVSLAAELVELQAADPTINDYVRRFQSGHHPGVPDRFDLGGMLATFMPGRLRCAEDLHSLWEALAELSVEVRAALLTPLSNDPTLAQLTTDAVWLRELRADTPAWDDLLSAMLMGYDRARAWGCLELAAAAAVTSMRIFNENLGRGFDALKFGRRVMREIGQNSRVLDAVADIMDRAGRPRAAYLLRLPIVPSWLPTAIDSLGPALIRRKAARSAARAGEWAAAAAYLSEAAGLIAQDSDEDIFRAGLLADAGHAASRAGDKQGAVHLLTASFQLLQSIPNDPTNRKAFRLHKLFGNLMAWLVEGTKTNSDGFGTFEQLPATCSDFEIARNMSDLPSTPIQYSALNLCRYAGAFQDGSELSKILDELRKSPLVVVRCLAGKVALDDAISRQDLAATFETAFRHARDLVYSVRRKAEPGLLSFEGETPSDIPLNANAIDELIKKPILTCMVEMIASHGWCATGTYDFNAAAADGIPTGLRLWMDAVACAGGMPTTERWESFLRARSTVDKYSTLMFAITLADDRNASTQQIAHTHAVLFQAVQNGSLPPSSASRVLTIFVKRWSEIAQQAFRLTTPRLTLPDLQAALLSKDEGLEKAGRLLLAGLPAVGLNVPGWLNEVLTTPSKRI